MNETLQRLGPEAKGSGSPSRPEIILNDILVPIDFSLASQRALAFASAIAKRFRSRLHLVHAVQPPSLPEWGYVHLARRDAKLRKTAEEWLPDFPRECGIDTRLVASSKVRTGWADFEICRAASEAKSDLIIIASHAGAGWKHAFTGSTTERVVRHAPCPVLTVREHAGWTEPGTVVFAPKRIVATTDFSAASKKAFPYAAALARKFEATLTLLYVLPSHLPAEIGQIGMVLEEKRLLEQARIELPRFRAAEIDPHMLVETLVLNGGVAHEICRAAETTGADLIVISTHGHTGLKHFLLGSVTENVLRHAPCPVLVVREREHDFLKLKT